MIAAIKQGLNWSRLNSPRKLMAVLILILVVEWLAFVSIQRVRWDIYFAFEYSTKNWTAVFLKYITMFCVLAILGWSHLLLLRNDASPRALKAFYTASILLTSIIGFVTIPLSCCSMNSCHYNRASSNQQPSLSNSDPGFAVLAIADPQFLERYNVFYSESLKENVNLNEKLVLFVRDFNNWCKEPSRSGLSLQDNSRLQTATKMFENLRKNNKCPTKLIIPGDLTEHSQSNQHFISFGQLEDFEYFYGLNKDGLIEMEIYESLGNHDYFNLFPDIIDPSKTVIDRSLNSTAVMRSVNRRNLYRTDIIMDHKTLGFYIAKLGNHTYVVNLQSCLQYFPQEGPLGAGVKWIDESLETVQKMDPTFQFIISLHFPTCLADINMFQRYGNRFLGIVHGHLHQEKTTPFQSSEMSGIIAPSPKFYWKVDSSSMRGYANSSFAILHFSNRSLAVYDVQKELGNNVFTVSSV